jgi:dihydrofolate reductase
MGRLRYQVACSLDGYIAASDGSYDWIPSDPAIDFDALFAQFDTLVMGRTTYEGTGGGGPAGGKRIVVLSRTLRQETHPKATIISTDVEARVEALKRETERDRTRRSS